MVKVEIFGLAMDEAGKAPIIVLKDDGETRVLPIWIGAVEAMAISIAIHEVDFHRPMTHDLLLNVIRSMNGEVNRIEITEIESGTFYAELVLTVGEETMRIDCRPSDAIALAVRCDCSIYVADSVLEEAGGPFPEHHDNVIKAEDSEQWMDELEKLSEEDTKYKM